MTATPILISDFIEIHSSGGGKPRAVTITVYESSASGRNASARFEVTANDFSVMADDLERAALLLRAKDLELEAQAKIDPN